MIRVTVELVPGGIEELSEVIARAVIANDATHPDHPRRGNYNAKFGKRRTGKIRTATVVDFPRKSRDVWELLRRALNDMEKR